MEWLKTALVGFLFPSGYCPKLWNATHTTLGRQLSHIYGGEWGRKAPDVDLWPLHMCMETKGQLTYMYALTHPHKHMHTHQGTYLEEEVNNSRWESPGRCILLEPPRKGPYTGQPCQDLFVHCCPRQASWITVLQFFSPCCGSTGLQMCYCVWFYLSAGDINPGPHAWVANTSPTEPLSQPLFLPFVPSLPSLPVCAGNGT